MNLLKYLSYDKEIFTIMIFVTLILIGNALAAPCSSANKRQAFSNSLEAIRMFDKNGDHSSELNNLSKRVNILTKNFERLSKNDYENEQYERQKKGLFSGDLSLLFPVMGKIPEGVKINSQDKDCPMAEDGLKLFACPSVDELGHYRCIDDHDLCDKIIHCPRGEDEDPTVCMFHRMTMSYFRILLDAVFGLTRSVV